MPSQIAALLLPALSILWQDGRPSQTTPTAAEIIRAVRELSDDDFLVRQRASRLLWQAGRAAEPALNEAVKSNDPEVVARARRILQSFEYGIYPDTPEHLVRLIAQFRYGNQTVKQQALRQLRDMEEISMLLALLEKEPDRDLREQLINGLLKDFDKIVGRLFVEQKWATAEQLLKLGAIHDSGMRNYAAYLLQRDQLAAKISELEARAGDAPERVDATLLAFLLRAGGDLHGARSAAEKTTDSALIGGILFELGDWKELARLHDAAAENTSRRVTGGIVDLGYAAAYHRLAGNTERFEQAVAGIKSLAERKPNKLWYCGEALIINDRFQDAVEVLKEKRPAKAFEILCCQCRFRAALALAGVRDPRGPYQPWFARPEPGSETTSSRRRGRFSMGLSVASVLCRLGEKEKATRLFSELADAARDDKNLLLRLVSEAEYEVGLTQEAFEHAAIVLSRGWNTSMLQTLFPRRSDTAEIWWKFLCGKYAEEPRQQTIGRLRRMLQPAPSGNSSADDWLDLVEEAETACRELDEEDQGKWLTALGETCLARGRPRLAQGYFEKAAKVAPSAASILKVADLLAEDTRWQQAAAWYRRAWQQDPTAPIALYLQGRALLHAGQEPEGRRLIEAAHMLPLGNAQTRYEFAKEIQRRGQTEEAVCQWELILRTGELRSRAVDQAASQLGSLATVRDDLEAAARWQWPLLRCLRTNTANLGVEGYLELAHRIHKVRARGLLAGGKIDEALEEIRLSHAALPGETGLAVELVPELEKGGRRTAADELFANVFRVNQQVCTDFPNSASYHGNLAWLAARCGRRLDEALAHARRAAGLAPDSPAFLDTLAEVHFRRGDRDQAVELARRCVELAPRVKHFRRQLDRFETP